jgi:fluoride exporter
VSWLLVGLGAAAGSVARHLLDGAVRRGHRFPTGVLAVNLLGCLLAGVVAGAAPGPLATDLLAVGLLGGFTTASTLAADVLQLAGDDDRRAAVLDLVLSLGPGPALAAAGLALGRALG